MAHARRLVTNPLKPGNWTTDTAQYTLSRRALNTLPAVDVKAFTSQASFNLKARWSEVYVADANRLRAQEYKDVRATAGEREARGVFVRKGGRTHQVTLDVTRRAQTFFVKLTRQKYFADSPSGQEPL